MSYDYYYYESGDYYYYESGDPICDRPSADGLEDRDARIAELEAALESILDCGSVLRSGVPDPMDLEGLSDGLERATDIAGDALKGANDA